MSEQTLTQQPPALVAVAERVYSCECGWTGNDPVKRQVAVRYDYQGMDWFYDYETVNTCPECGANVYAENTDHSGPELDF